MNQEGVRRVAGNRQCYAHDVVSMVPWWIAVAGRPPPEIPAADPLAAKARPLGGGVHAVADEGNGLSTGTGG